MIYVMSAYSLAVIIASVPKLLKDIKTAFNNSRIMQKIRASYFGRKYFDDLAFRGSVNIYQGMLINFLFYVIFRIAKQVYAMLQCGLFQWQFITLYLADSECI